MTLGGESRIDLAPVLTTLLTDRKHQAPISPRPRQALWNQIEDTFPGLKVIERSLLPNQVVPEHCNTRETSHKSSLRINHRRC